MRHANWRPGCIVSEIILMKHILSLIAGFGGLGITLAAGAADPAPAQKTDPAAASYQIRSKKFGDLLRPQDANNATGTPIVLYSAQMWKCMTWKLIPAGDSCFQVQNHFTSKTFAPDAKSDKAPAPVTQMPLAGESKDRASWVFTKLSDGSFKVTDPKTGKALTASSNSSSQAAIVLEDWKDKDEQKWELIETDPKKLTM
jgi:hypothetical protein